MIIRQKQMAQIIQTMRAHYYSMHYEYRRLFAGLPKDYTEKISEALNVLVPFPLPGLLGEMPKIDSWLPINVQKIVFRAWGYPYRRCINPWYFSDQGWEAFQRAWAALPEPDELFHRLRNIQKPVEKVVDNPVEILWISTKKVWKTAGNPVDKLPSFPQVIIGFHRFPQYSRNLSSACGKLPIFSTTPVENF